MSLPTGATVGPYEIAELIGVGGMGEVYRARDARLGRDVAVKILPEQSAEHRARLVREARVLASLKHSSICTLHGIQEVDSRPALVLELVDGGTLADRLSEHRGGLPLRDVLSIAGQVADAIAVAHDHGIVHRDLKPSNIALESDGTVKVLDFGLAKLLETSRGPEAEPAVTLTASPSETMLGTPAYMSPEQARGEPADASADVWAFGCILYEMLTGQSAFGCATPSETFAQVLHFEPDLDLLPDGTPPLLRRLVRRCLEKERHRRLRHFADARADIEDALAVQLESTEGGAGRQRRALGVGLLTLAPIALLAAAAAWFLPRSPPADTIRSIFAADPPWPFGPVLRFTSDGSHLLYASPDRTEILLHPVDSLEAVPLVTSIAGTDLRDLAVSPDDQQVAYVETNYALKKVAITGGPPNTLVRFDGTSRGVTWTSGDTLIFATAAPDTGLQSVSEDGGEAVVLTHPDRERGEADHFWPEALPDGRSVLFTIFPVEGNLDAARVAVLDLESGEIKTLFRGGHHAVYAPSGHLLYAAGGALRAADFDLRRLEMRGTPVTVAPRVSTSLAGSAHFAVGPDMLVYLEPEDVRHTLVWVDRRDTDTETALPTPPGAYEPRISPTNDARLAVTSGGDIWVLDLAREPFRLTSNSPALDWLPLWMPDGERLVFGSWRGGGQSNLYIQPADGSQPAERLSDSSLMQLPSGITVDGSSVLFMENSATRADIRLLRLASGAAEESVLVSPLDERGGVVSPNMQWLAYESESAASPGRFQVYVRPFPVVDDGRVWQVSTNGGTHPLWSPKGDELFYVSEDDAIMAVPVRASGDGWIPAAPAQLFAGPYFFHHPNLARQYDVTSDGQRFLLIKEERSASPSRIVLVQHWEEQLKQARAAR